MNLARDKEVLNFMYFARVTPPLKIAHAYFDRARFEKGQRFAEARTHVIVNRSRAGSAHALFMHCYQLT